MKRGKRSNISRTVIPEKSTPNFLADIPSDSLQIIDEQMSL